MSPQGKRLTTFCASLRSFKMCSLCIAFAQGTKALPGPNPGHRVAHGEAAPFRLAALATHPLNGGGQVTGRRETHSLKSEAKPPPHPSRRRRVKLKNLKKPFPLWYCVPPSPRRRWDNHRGTKSRQPSHRRCVRRRVQKTTVQLWPPFPSSFSYTEYRPLTGLSQTMGNGEYRTVAGGPGQGGQHFLLCQ